MSIAGQLVSLVIPGRDCESTLRACLDAAVAVKRRTPRLAEILFVDDGSRDGSAGIARSFAEVTYVAGCARGPAAARNLGWRRAANPLVWFVDSDCVADVEALEHLLPHLDVEGVAGVSGTYDNARPDSILATLIHEEIRERHLAMPREVDFLATFDVLYRRQVLEALDGFDERYKKAQDAELAMRCREAGHALHHDNASRVAHHHETRWLGYFRTQRLQGFWRVWLHLERRGHAAGDSYSSLVDHLQPPVACLVLGSLPLALVPWGWIAPSILGFALGAMQLPMTGRLVRRTGEARMLMFAWMSFLRAFWRAVGMALGVLDYLRRSGRASSGG